MAEPFSLTGMAALVSGGSRGIGHEISPALARAGADVAFLFRSRQDQAERTRGEVQNLGWRGLAIQLDVGDIPALGGAIDAVAQEFGRLDILVNNAGCRPRLGPTPRRPRRIGYRIHRPHARAVYQRRTAFDRPEPLTPGPAVTPVGDSLDH